MATSSRISSFLLALVVLSCTRADAQRRPKDKILDRKVFEVSMQLQTDKRNAPEPFEDEISFRSNKVCSRHMQIENGFQKGEYVIFSKEQVLDEMKYMFEGINKNSKGMSLKWMGTVFGGQIEGTAIVSKKGKVKQEFTFAGTEKK